MNKGTTLADKRARLERKVARSLWQLRKFERDWLASGEANNETVLLKPSYIEAVAAHEKLAARLV